MFKKELERCAPEAAGISSARVRQLIEALEGNSEMHGFMLSRGGRVLAETFWKPYHAELPHILHSLGKTYVGTGIGLAVTEGILRLDEHITDLFSDSLEEYGIVPSSLQKKLTVRDLLMMSNGMARQPRLDEHLVENYLREPVVYEPGSCFKYNTAGTSLLCEILRRRTGRQISDYMTEKLFHPIGIETDKLNWLTYRNGLDASPGISTTLENNLRLGLLYMNGGCFDGKRYLSEDYVRSATSCQIDNAGTSADPEACAGYGYQMWMCTRPGVFRFDGGHGQFVVVCPEKGIVISLFQSSPSFPAATRCLEIIQDFIGEVGSESALSPAPDAEEALAAYLSSRELDRGTAAPIPENVHRLDGIYHTIRGELNIYPETRVDNKDNWDSVFYSFTDTDIRSLSIAASEKGFVEITFNNLTVLKVRLDGINEITDSVCAIPSFCRTCSTGFFDGEDTLVVHTRWIQTCPSMTLTFRRYESSLSLNAVISTLHDFGPETVYHLELRPAEI